MVVPASCPSRLTQSSLHDAQERGGDHSSCPRSLTAAVTTEIRNQKSLINTQGLRGPQAPGVPPRTGLPGGPPGRPSGLGLPGSAPKPPCPGGRTPPSAAGTAPAAAAASPAPPAPPGCSLPGGPPPPRPAGPGPALGLRLGVRPGAGRYREPAGGARPGPLPWERGQHHPLTGPAGSWAPARSFRGGRVSGRGLGPFKSGAAMICLVLGLFAGLFQSGAGWDWISISPLSLGPFYRRD